MIASVRLAVLLLAASLLVAPATARSQGHANLSSVHDGSGTMSSGGAYTNWSAAGQPGGITVSSGGTLTNHAGFLQAADIKHPSQDTDADGIPDEIDTDNDADGLADAAEVNGSSFDPATSTTVNNPDSDGDGVNDGWEAAAETDPSDEHANLRILSISNVPGGKQITYLARADKEYTIRNGDGSYAYPANALDTDTETGGAGVWMVRTNTFEDASGTATGRYYAIEPMPR